MAYEIIKEVKKINASIKTAGSMGARYHDLLHTLAVSTLVHAAEHGNTTPLNDFFKVLTVNYQTSLKNYIRVLQDNELLDVKFLTMKDNQFVMRKECDDQKLKFMELADRKLINPDGEEFKKFFERDIVQDIKDFADKQVLSQLKSMLKKAKGEVDTVNPIITPAVLSVLENAVAGVEKHVH